MSACTTETMTSHHHTDFSHPIALISDTLHTWRQRYQSRRELAHLSDRDFHDVGASWSDFAIEANKPFWQA
ncbi:MAG: DUF1127 domain-containing protein [Pseudomonadota bacterium]